MFVCNGLLKLSVNEFPELAVLRRHHPNGRGRIVDAGLISYSLVTDFFPMGTPQQQLSFLS